MYVYISHYGKNNFFQLNCFQNELLAVSICVGGSQKEWGTLSSEYCANLDTMLQKIAHRAVVEFYNFTGTFHSHSTRATYSILSKEKVQQWQSCEARVVA